MSGPDSSWPRAPAPRSPSRRCREPAHLPSRGARRHRTEAANIDGSWRSQLMQVSVHKFTRNGVAAQFGGVEWLGFCATRPRRARHVRLNLLLTNADGASLAQ